MNILMLSTHLNTGGIGSYILTMAKGLCAQGHQVFVATSGGNLEDQLSSCGAKHIRLNIRTKSEASWKVYLAVGQVERLIKDHKIDVIHAHTRVTQVLATLVKKRTKVTYISTCHGFFRNHLFRRMFPCWGDAVIAISKPVEEHLIRDFKIPREKVVLISNGIDLSQFQAVTPEQRQQLRRTWDLDDAPVVGIIARLSDVKGHEFLIKAMKRVIQKIPRARLLIIGEGPMEDLLRSLVQTMGLTDHIFFHKIVNRTAEVLPLFDVFVMPSLQEGLGLSVMEAQAVGLPVVASRVGGLPEIVEDGKTGMLVPSQDVEALAEAIVSVLEHKASSDAMGLAARAFIQRTYSADDMVERTFDLYQRLAKKQ